MILVCVESVGFIALQDGIGWLRRFGGGCGALVSMQTDEWDSEHDVVPLESDDNNAKAAKSRKRE